MEYKDTDQFAFFVQDVEDGSKHPNFKSNGKYAIKLSDEMVDYIVNGGRVLEVAGWKRKSGGGKAFISCQVSQPYEKPEADY